MATKLIFALKRQLLQRLFNCFIYITSSAFYKKQKQCTDIWDLEDLIMVTLPKI